MLTTNLAMGTWGQIFDDAMVPPPWSTGSSTAASCSTSLATATGSAITKPAPTNWPGEIGRVRLKGALLAPVLPHPYPSGGPSRAAHGL